MYQELLDRLLPEEDREDQAARGAMFMKVLAESTATLYVMEPMGDTIIFKGLGLWPIPSVPVLLHDPNAFIAEGFGGGKFKVNFHHGQSFIGTHNFRTYGEELWRDMDEVAVG